MTQYSRNLIYFCSLLAMSAVAAPAAQTDAPGENNNPIVCESANDARIHCPADTTAGVLLSRSTGETPCLLGKNWGYDDAGVWVVDGCSGEFMVQGVDTGEAGVSQQQAPVARNETWGVLDPGKGFLVGRGEQGELSISAYALVRYINQMPADQTFTDHLGRERPVDSRQDIYSHRIILWFKGWLADPKLVYNIALWTVNTTDQDALFGNIGYQFNKYFNLYGGLNGNPGSRSMQGSHPYWLGHDRVMADEFFRPFFAMGVWANGQLLPGLWYNLMVGNTSSTLGVTASQIDRQLTTGGSVWWMPTTREFGPRGAFGDWEMHEQVATRFGLSTTFSPEERYTDIGTDPGNTAIKLADSVNLFEQGALAPGLTVTDVDYRILSLDAGLKYRGFFIQTEIYQRWLDDFEADGAVPVAAIEDWGFYVQTAFFPVPRKLELYAATSWIFGDSDAGFDNSYEYLLGANWYFTRSRNHRVNLQVIDVNRSPVSSTFGYYTGGQDGTTLSLGVSIFF